MSIVNYNSKDVKSILESFGIIQKYVVEAHIHIVVGKPVWVDILSYTDVNKSNETELKRYNLVPIEEEQSVEEMKQNLIAAIKPLVKKFSVSNNLNN